MPNSRNYNLKNKINATLTLSAGKTLQSEDREIFSNEEKRAVKDLLMEGDSSMDVFQIGYNNRES